MFLGPRSGGKSSIRKVVFERMAPNDTLFIEKTAKSTADDIKSVDETSVTQRRSTDIRSDHIVHSSRYRFGICPVVNSIQRHGI